MREEFTIDLSSYLTKRTLIEYLRDNMPSYLKQFLRYNYITYQFATNKFMESDKDESEHFNNCFGVCLTFENETLNNEIFYSHKIFLNYENIIKIESDTIPVEHEDIYYRALNYSKGNKENVQDLIDYILIHQLSLSFYHELAHAIDTWLYENQDIYMMDIPPEQEDDCYLFFSKRDDMFATILENNNIGLNMEYDDVSIYEEEDFIPEAFAELLGMFLVNEIYRKQYESFDWYRAYLNEDFMRYFNHIMDMIAEPEIVC